MAASSEAHSTLPHPQTSAQTDEARSASAEVPSVHNHNAAPTSGSSTPGGHSEAADVDSKAAILTQQNSHDDAPAAATPATQGDDAAQPSGSSKSQSAAPSTSASTQPEAMDTSFMGPSPYGTRSRNRTGNARPNYAEDQDMDFEIAAQPAATAAPGKAANATESKREKLAAESRRQQDSGFSRFVTVNGLDQTHRPSPPAKEPIPGTSQFHSNPSKKRKVAGGNPAASHAAATASPAPSASTTPTARPPAQPSLAYSGREINMMSFTKCKAKLKNGKLAADDGTVLSVNDHVYLVCEPPGDPYYLCRIMEFLHSKSDDPTSPVDSIRVNWFYRPRDVQRFNHDSRLVYGTMHSDMCPLTSLRGKCTILHRSEIDDLDEYRKGKDCFHFSQIFDRFIRRFYEVIPTSQVINVPEKVKKALDERWKFIAVEVGRVKELTSAVKSCKRCAGYCASNDSVDCALCKTSYHLNCVRPPLPKKPSRGFAWACGPCSRAQEKKLEARHTPLLGQSGTDGEEEEVVEEEEEDPALMGSTRAPSPTGSEMDIDQHPGTQAEIALAKMWPMRYLGIHCRVEDALQYDDRAIYPRASSRLGPRHQANVNVWHGRPVEFIPPKEIKKKMVKATSHKKDAKYSKETIAALEADRVEKAKRPKWQIDEPPGYVHRGEDHENKDSKNTARLMFKMPPQGVHSERGLDDRPAVTEKDVDEYMAKAKTYAKVIGVPEYGTNFLDRALQLYTDCNYDATAALKKLKKTDRYHDLKEPVLTKDELKKFEEGVAKYGSEHRLIRLHMKTDLPNSVIVRFYYLWKKTPRGREIWGSYGGRKGNKKRPDTDASAKLQAEVAHDVDDSAFDNDKAVAHKRGFQCKFCSTKHSRQWRRAPGVAPGQTVPADGKSGSKDKTRLLLALCLRCAGLWRRYAIQYEDENELGRKIAAGGRAAKRKVDEELLRELRAANEAAGIGYGTPEASGTPLPWLEPSVEPPKKKAKTAVEKDGAAETAAKKKEKPAPPPKLPTPPPPPIVPDEPKWRALPCAVCKTLDTEAGEAPVSCTHCKLTVHARCYGISTPAKKWVCDQCSNDRNPTVSTDYTCTLCPIYETKQELFEPPKVSHKKKTDREREKERMEKELIDQAKHDYAKKQTEYHRPLNPREALKKTDGNNWMHVICAVWTPEIRFSDAKHLERAESQGLIPDNRFEMVCKICKSKDQHGACVSCLQCHANFHVACACEAGYTFGFDVTPVKGSRKDQITTVTLGQETGYLTAAIWCKEHTIKTIVHPMSEMVDDTGKTALQLFVENYKQADQTLTGAARKANLLSNQSTKIAAQPASAPVAPVAPVNRRISTASAAATGRRGARHSSVGIADKGDEEGTPASTSAAATETPANVCVKCGIDVSPKWWLDEKKRDPTPGVSKPTEPSKDVTMDESTDMNRQENGDNVKDEGPVETSVPSAAPAPTTEAVAEEQRPTEYHCHKCHWKMLNEPTPPPEPPSPKRMSISPPRTFPLQLGGWLANGTPAPQPTPGWPDQQQSLPPSVHLEPSPPVASVRQRNDFRAPLLPNSNFALPQPLQTNGVGYERPPPNLPPFSQPNGHPAHPYQPAPPHLPNLPPASQQLPNGLPSPQYPLQSPTLLHRSSSSQGFAPPPQPISGVNGQYGGNGQQGSPPNTFARPATPRETSAGPPRSAGAGGATESRERVRELLEAGKDEELIEKETGVSDRTIRRWKLELERFGRIGKPPESRTGRHRVMGPDVEQALFEHVAQKPDMSVDDMLWWLYDRYKLVVGTRTIRRAFERRNTSHKKFRTQAKGGASRESDEAQDEEGDTSHMTTGDNTYQSPYAPMAPMGNNPGDISPDLARALGGLANPDNSNIHPDLVGDGAQLSEDEETLQLQLQQIALQKREVELKLKMRRLQRAKGNTGAPSNMSSLDESMFLQGNAAAGPSTSEQTTPVAAKQQKPKVKTRDSRSKNKIEEAKKRTEERQERMLKDLERRSRRREHLTAEWSKDIWPQRAQNLLQDLMHRYSTYAYNQNSLDTFENIFRELYQLVDHSDWYPPVHDDLLRERTRRKMSQLRSKMVKSGEIVSRGEGYGGWSKADGDVQAGASDAAVQHNLQHDMQQHELQQHDMQQHDMQMTDMQQLGIDMQDGHMGDAHMGGTHMGDGHDGHAPDMLSPDAMLHAQHAHQHAQDQDMLAHQQALAQYPDLPQQVMQHHGDLQADMQDHADMKHHADLQHHADLTPDDYLQQQADLARQHELLAQQGIAQQEQMAHHQLDPSMGVL